MRLEIEINKLWLTLSVELRSTQNIQIDPDKVMTELLGGPKL